MNFKHRPHLLALAAMSLCFHAQAQQSTAAADTAKLDRVEVTGSLIKRTDRETPSVVQVISREDIKNSGFATVEELLRSVSAVDASSVQDGAGSGFVAGVSTISLRGFGSQGTLILINGRRTAPVAAVDINFGRGSLVSVNTIPKAAIERIEILKDGASALYGSDAMAGVINYVLRKEYQGLEGEVSYGANDKGVGATQRGAFTFGFGNLDTQRFNVYGGIDVSKRDSVMHSELKDRGNFALSDDYGVLNGSLRRFTPDSSASPFANYYRVPASLAGSTTIDGRSVANSNLQGANYLGTFAGCPDELTVGKGVPNRPEGFLSGTASMRNGYCRFNFDNADEAISAQERINGSLRANFAVSRDIMAYADLMVSQTKTTEQRIPYAMTTTLVTSANPVATTWPKLDGTFLRQNALILPVGHPDNPTNGQANSQPVQLIYRFTDFPQVDLSELKSTRFVTGFEGTFGGWDVDSALLFSQQDNVRNQTNRVRSSLLTKSIAAGTYRFGKVNTPEAVASIASDAINEGKATITSLDVRASRELFQMAGGRAAVAVGAELRREELESIPSDIYQSGDFIGLVANGAAGSRNSQSVFGELRLPVAKSLELQGALRHEHFSDFGNSTTGKAGFKWSAMPSMLVFRGTAATGFRAPALSQIGNSFLMSFHSSQERRIVDSLRCNAATFTSKADPAVNRDCNVLGFSAVPAGTVNPGSIPSVVSANPDLKPETSRSFTLGVLVSPSNYVDLGVDVWYFHRKDEIRVQRGIDIMDAYNANPSANAGTIIRDPNPASWLPGVANSGPILALVRGYGNYNWTKTAGADYDLNIRFPVTELGKFGLKINGTYTARFDQKVLATSPVQYLAGDSAADMPKSKASATLSWSRGDWASWVRYNHIDSMVRSTTASCLSSTTAANVLLQANNGCKVGQENSFDLNLTYKGIKGLTIAGSILNVTDDYDRSINIPSTFNYWDQGTQGQLGRRFNINVSYQFK